MTPFTAPEGSIWLFTPIVDDGFNDNEAIFMVLGKDPKNYFRYCLSIHFNDDDELEYRFTKDSRMNLQSTRLW